MSWVTLPLEPQKEMRNSDGGAASSVTSTRHRLQLRIRLRLRLRLLWRFRLRFCTKNVNRMSHWIDLQCRNKAILTHSGKSLDREISHLSLLSHLALVRHSVAHASPGGSGEETRPPHINGVSK